MLKLTLKIITPEKLVYEAEVSQVSIPTTEGEITILPSHISLVSTLASGDIVAKIDEEFVPFAVSGGFIKVENDEVAIMADFAEHVADIGDDVIAKAEARAKELQSQFDNKEIVDFEHFESELERSLTRVKIADKWKSKKYKKL
jgi:F-type H+-transporting ATPase subunit epsilon